MARKNEKATKRGQRDNPLSCPRAHFHRPGSYCKSCRSFIPSAK